MKKWIILLLFPVSVVAQTWTWGIKGTGNHQPRGDMEISAFNDGSSVVVGYFQKELKLGDFRLYTDDDHYSDLYLARISKSGKVLWAKQMEAGSTYGNQLGLATDDDRNIYLTGAYNGYMYVAKMDSTGNEIWRNDFNRQYYGYGASIATDQTDNVYLLGGGGWNFFSARLNYHGKVDWIQNVGVNYSAGFSITDMELDAVGNMYFAGTYGVDSITLGDIHINQKSSAVWGKISPEGKFLWAKSSSGRVNNARVALSGNTLYISGSFTVEMKIGEVTLPGLCCSNPKPFIARFDTAGNQVWAKLGNTTYESKGSISYTKTDGDGNLYVAGGYFTCYGVHCTEGDYFIEKYNSSGSVQWRLDFNHESGDGCSSFDFDNSGNLYLAARTMAADFTNPRSESATNSFGIGKLATGQTTARPIERPRGARVQYLCDPVGTIRLVANGQNLKWYEDASLKLKVHEGNDYLRQITSTDTVYVTQTIGNSESRPKQVIIYKPQLEEYTIDYVKDTLSTSYNEMIGYQWYYNSEKIITANRHFILPDKNGVYEVELLTGSCSKRLAFEYQRPEPPAIDSLIHFCPDEPGIVSASGSNIVWYSSVNYRDTLGVGRTYQLPARTNRQLYVRQTVNGISSNYKTVLVSFSEIRDTIIGRAPSQLIAQRNNQFSYRWSYYNELLPDTLNIISPQKNGRYTVTITDGHCSRTLSAYFVMQPKVEKTMYFRCPADTLPVVRASGKNVVWVAPNYTSWEVDTLARGPEFKPTQTTRMAYVIDRDSSYTSYPLLIQFLSPNFSMFKTSIYGSNLYVSAASGTEQGYSFAWYRESDSVPVASSQSCYNANFGNYRLHITFNNSCDTLLTVKHFPAYDSIQYVCQPSSPLLYIAPVSLEWYADKALTTKLYTGTYFYPWTITNDTAVYVAQRSGGKVFWQGKIELRYPDLTKVSVRQQDGKLLATPAKPYYRYQWKFNDRALSDSISSVVPVEDGLYSVRITAGSCYTTVNHQFARSGIAAVNTNDSFQISPNPATDFLWIENTDGTDGPVAIKLFNLNGQLVAAYDAMYLPYRLNIQTLTPGIYIVEIKTGSTTFKTKVVING